MVFASQRIGFGKAEKVFEDGKNSLHLCAIDNHWIRATDDEAFIDDVKHQAHEEERHAPAVPEKPTGRCAFDRRQSPRLIDHPSRDDQSQDGDRVSPMVDPLEKAVPFDFFFFCIRRDKFSFVQIHG